MVHHNKKNQRRKNIFLGVRGTLTHNAQYTEAVLLLAHEGLRVIFESPEHSIGAVEASSTEQLKQLPAHPAPVQSCMCVCVCVCVYMYVCVCVCVCVCVYVYV